MKCACICFEFYLQTNWQIQKKQLEETLALKAKMQACPVLIVALNMEVSKRKVRDDLGLEKLKESGELSSYEIVSVDANTDAAQLHEEVFGLHRLPRNVIYDSHAKNIPMHTFTIPIHANTMPMYAIAMQKPCRCMQMS